MSKKKLLSKMYILRPITNIDTFKMMNNKLSLLENKTKFKKKIKYFEKIEEKRRNIFIEKFGHCLITSYTLNKIEKFTRNNNIVFYSNKHTFIPKIMDVTKINVINFFKYFNKILFIVMLDTVDIKINSMLIGCRKLILITNINIEIHRNWKLYKKISIPSWNKQQYVYFYKK